MTVWTKDDGTTLIETLALFVDESDNLFIDENGLFLVDIESTDGHVLPNAWDATISASTDDTTWANTVEDLSVLYDRINHIGRRVTAQGDSLTSRTNHILDVSSWGMNDAADNDSFWINTRETISISYNLINDRGTRITEQGWYRTCTANEGNKTTEWSNV
jgi:hypothetical protein